MRFRWQRAATGWLLWALSGLTTVPAGSISTDQIILETIHPATLASCMKWTYPIGLCFWLRCGATGCTIRTSLMVGHYNPDLVMTGYHRVGETPWVEMAALYGPLQRAAGQGVFGPLKIFIGGGNQADKQRSRHQHEDLRFKEADAIGHPATLLTLLGESYGLLCPSETLPFMPYLLSTLDLLAWRFGLPELVYPEALLPGLREIGQWPANTWSAVYPRQGWVMQSEDPKAGAVVVQRAGDVVTREKQPHVYLPTTLTRPATDMEVWWPEALRELDRKTGHFQMLVPLKSRSCEVFGQNDTLSLASWADHKVDEAGDYAWTLWRPYKCCPPRGQLFLRAIQWRAWPP